MSHLILPRREIWTSQPQGQVEIDWSNPITRGLISGFLCGSSVDVVNRSLLTGVSKYGSIKSGIAGYGVSKNAYSRNTTDPVTILVLGVFVSSTANNPGIYGASTWASVSNNSGISVFRRHVTPFLLQVGLYNNNNLNVSAGFDATLKTPYLVCVGYDGANYFIDVDGTQKATGTLPAGIRSPNITESYGSTASGIAPVAISLRWSRALSVSERISIAANPWQIIAPARSQLFVPLSAGSGALSASGGASAGGSANIAAQIALAAIGVSTASGTATATASVPLSAAGITISDGTANAQATVTITAAGLAQAAGQAGLSAAILLQGAAAAQASGNATLATKLTALAAGTAQAAGSANLTGGAPGALAATGQAHASGSAALILSIELATAGSAQSSGSANLTSGNLSNIAAAGQAQASGTAYPTIRINPTAAGQAQATGTAAGTLSAGNQITALGTSNAAGSAALTVTVTLTAAGFVHAMGAGGLAVEAPLSAIGQANAAGTANLALVPDYLPVAPLSLVAGISRPTRLSAAAQRPVILRHEVTRVYQH